MGKLRLQGRHRFLIGDCTDEKDVACIAVGETADCVFTSPPYSDLRNYGGGNLAPEHLAKFFDFPAKLFFVNLGLIIREREIVPYWDAYLVEAKKRNLKLLSWNIWDKGNASAPAHQQAMFGLSHEWIFVFGEYKAMHLTKPNKTPGEMSWGIGTVREKDGSLTSHSKKPIRSHRQLDTIIAVEPQRNFASDYSGHPAPFPVALAEEFIKASTNENDLVADPFAGAGTTMMTAFKLGRRSISIELEPLYADVAIERFVKFSGKPAVREDGVEWVS